jgi:hypothetical protein
VAEEAARAFEKKALKDLEAARHAAHGTVRTTCRKCGGSGNVNTNVVHCGLPGTCYMCDGFGVTMTRTGYDHSSVVSIQLEALRIAYRGVRAALKAVEVYALTARPFEVYAAKKTLTGDLETLEYRAKEVKASVGSAKGKMVFVCSLGVESGEGTNHGQETKP